MPKEKSIFIISSERCTASSFYFKTSIALRSSRAVLIAPIDSFCEYKAIFPCTGIHKPRLPHSFCFLDYFIIVGVCFGINYHNNVEDFGRTCGRMLFYKARITEVSSAIKRLEE
ncbi:hypothetical protein DVH24_023920 [Malus domestica]|uniref:Uncharacterized protein n=1 Tax=Malus domestica TaxID=3750 RepID=A0A498JGG4_MALDO|nr:hypothetical protein DVH24_023920 [Malus domestica]